MGSPFRGFQNAVLEFQILSDRTQEDEWGNQSPIFDVVQIEAMLEIVTDSTLQRFLQGNQRTEEDAIALSGHCVEPMILPMQIKLESEAALNFNYSPGKFVLTTIGFPWGREGIGKIYEKAEGTRILGWFIPTR